MSRKFGDKAYESYLNYQAFSSDMPTHRINQTNWYLKFEKNLPAFFIKADDVFQQMPPLSFFATAERSTLFDFTGWQDQIETYFNLTTQEIKCLTDKEHLANLPSTPPLEATSST
tara:strand:+ start:258 stop:602 length:345 start_codon:yes stop_codon:yes gene_type:complete